MSASRTATSTGSFPASSSPSRDRRRHQSHMWTASRPVRPRRTSSTSIPTASLVWPTTRSTTARVPRRRDFNHYDLFFADGGNPTDAIMKKFVEIAENEPGVLAVHYGGWANWHPYLALHEAL